MVTFLEPSGPVNPGLTRRVFVEDGRVFERETGSGPVRPFSQRTPVETPTSGSREPYTDVLLY